MSKSRELKEQKVAEIKERFEKAQGIVVIDYRGINVEQVTALRKQFREAGVEYVVLKNTLVQRVADEMGKNGLDHVLTGPNAFAFGYDDPVAPAKVITDFITKTKCEHLEIKAGVVEGKVIDPEGVKALASLPSKGSMIVGVLAAMLRSVLYVLDSIRKQKEGE